MHDQEVRIATKHHRHSLSGEPRTGRHDQEVKIAARHHSYSLPGDPRMGMIRRLEF